MIIIITIICIYKIHRTIYICIVSRLHVKICETKPNFNNIVKISRFLCKHISIPSYVIPNLRYLIINLQQSFSQNYSQQNFSLNTESVLIHKIPTEIHLDHRGTKQFQYELNLVTWNKYGATSILRYVLLVCFIQL